MTRVRALVIAEEANPAWVSVPLVGWSHARALMDVADVHLVTQVRNRDAIAATGLVEGRDFTALDSEAVARPLWRLGSLLRGGAGRGWTTLTAINAIAYRYFEHRLWRRFGADLRAGRYDLVHRVTPLSPTTPSALAARCARAGVPFVLGPLNGGVPWPSGFDGARRREREWLSYLRGAHRLLPGYAATRRHAAAIMIGSRDTWAQMPARHHHRYVYVPENGIDLERFPAPVPRAPGRPLRLVFIGRLVPYKGADMLIEAMAPLARDGAVALEIVGDGPMRGAIEAQIAEAGIAGAVRLHGWVEHAAMSRRLADADVLAFPSIREFGGGVVLEAMACGVVPLVVAYGGPAELVTPGTGFTVPIGRRDAIVAGFRARLEALVADPSRLPELARAARRRVETCFTWPAKAQQTLAVWHWTLGRAGKPDFGMPLRELAEVRCAA